jgi:hypothetical protein
MAIVVYPPPGPRDDKPTRGDRVMLALCVLVGLAIIGAAIWFYVSGVPFS